MLSELDVGQFRTFGFIVLRSCLAESEVKNLQEAHDRVMAGAPEYAVRDLRAAVEAHLSEEQPFVYSREMMKNGGAGRE